MGAIKCIIMKKKNTGPIRKKEEVPQSNDERIDEDFPGFPHHPSKKETISNGSANAFEGTENVRDDEGDQGPTRHNVLPDRGK